MEGSPPSRQNPRKIVKMTIASRLPCNSAGTTSCDCFAASRFTKSSALRRNSSYAAAEVVSKSWTGS